jgi:LEA14-like dessication related protein
MQSLYGLIFLMFVSACGKFKEPEFRGIENIQTEKVGLSGTTLKMDLIYFNPNPSRITLKKAEGNAWLDGNALGQFSIDSAIRIEPKSSFRLPARLQLDMKNVLRNSVSALFNDELILKIEGKAKVGKSGIYINYPIKYEGKHDISGLLK